VRQAEQVLTKKQEKSNYGENEGDDGYDPTGGGGGFDDDDGFGGARRGGGGNFWDGVTSMLGQPQEDGERDEPPALWQDRAEPHPSGHEDGVYGYTNGHGGERSGRDESAVEWQEQAPMGESEGAGAIFTVEAEDPSDRHGPGPGLWSLVLEAPSEDEAERWAKAMSRLRDWDHEAASALEAFKRSAAHGTASSQGSEWQPAASPPKSIAGNLFQRIKRDQKVEWMARWVVAKIERGSPNGSNGPSREWASGDWVSTISVADSPHDLREASTLISENAKGFRRWVRSRNGPGFIGSAEDVMASAAPTDPSGDGSGDGGGMKPKPFVAVYNLRQADDIIVSQFAGPGSRTQWEAQARKEVESGRSAGYSGAVGDVDGSIHAWNGTPSQADFHSADPHIRDPYNGGAPTQPGVPLRWECSVCTFDNVTASHPKACEMCGAAGGPPPPPPPAPAPKPEPEPTASQPYTNGRAKARPNGQRRDSWTLDGSTGGGDAMHVREGANYSSAKSAAEAMRRRDRHEQERGERMSESMSQVGDGSQWETGSAVSSAQSVAARRRRAAQNRQGGRRRSKQDIKKGGVAAARSGSRRPSASLTPQGRQREGQGQSQQAPAPVPAPAPAPQSQPAPAPAPAPQSQPVPSLWSDEEDEDAPVASAPALVGVSASVPQPTPQPAPAPAVQRAIAGGVALPGFPAPAASVPAPLAHDEAMGVDEKANGTEGDHQVPAPAPFSAATSQSYSGEMVAIRSHTRYREYFYMRSVGVSLEVVSRQMRDIGLDERILSLDVATQVPSDCDDVMSWLQGRPPTAPKASPASKAPPIPLEEPTPPPLPPTPPPPAPVAPGSGGGSGGGGQSDSELAAELADSIKREALGEDWEKVDGLLRRASSLEVTVELLQTSGIGRIVGALVRAPDEGTQLLAREIVRNWKGAVKKK